MADRSTVATQFVSIADVAQQWGVDPRTVRRLISKGHLHAYRLGRGRTLRIRQADADAVWQRIPSGRIGEALGGSRDGARG